MDRIIANVLGRISDEDIGTNNAYILLSDYKNEVKLWLENLGLLCDLYSGVKCVDIESLWKFDLSIVANFSNRNLVLYMCQSLTKSSPETWKQYVDILHRPRHYKFGSMGFKINFQNEYITNAEMRYISNFDAKRILDDADIILKDVTAREYEFLDYEYVGNRRCNFQGRSMLYSEKMTIIREAVLYSNFVKMYSTSRRMLNLSRLMIVLFETSNFCQKRGFVWYENPVALALRDLLNKWKVFPFREVETETLYTENCSFALPQLCYALIQLWFQYMLLDISRDELCVIIESYLEKACKSFDEWVLEFKDYRSRCDKYLTGMIQVAVGIKYGYKNPIGIVVHENPYEIFYDRDLDYATFSEKFVQLCPKALLRDLIEKKIIEGKSLEFTRSRVIPDVTEAKRLYEYITIACQHGLFIKNPVSLTLQKSILPGGLGTFGGRIEQEVEMNLGDYNDCQPIKFQFEDNAFFKLMLDEGRCLVEKYSKLLNLIDLEQEFIRALTNNSGGVSYEPTESEKQQVDESILRSLAKKRLMYYILNLEKFDSYEEWKRNVLQQATSGERKQVDRRGRVIQMVSNLAQLGPFAIYLFADLLSSIESELSTKKNTGTCRDMLPLLVVSGVGDAVTEAADVKGMDANTTQIHTEIVNQIVSDAYLACDHDKYFFCVNKKLGLIKRNENDEIIERVEVKVNPVSQMLLLTRKDAETHNFFLNMREQSYRGVKIIINTSNEVFPSGRYSTNAQHGIFNTLLLRVIKKCFKMMMNRKLKVNRRSLQFITKVSGDDILISMFISVADLPIGVEFSKYLLDSYCKAGFRLSSELCRFSATFLQQKAYFGTVLPKPDRLSIVSSEHGESVKTNIMVGFSEIRDLLDEIAGRVHFPHNTTIILYAIANGLRRVRCVTDPTLSEAMRKIEIDNVVSQKRFLRNHWPSSKNREGLTYKVLIGERYVHIVLPFVYLFSRKGFDLPPMVTCFKRLSHKFGAYSPRGDLHEWMLRQIVTNDIDFKKYLDFQRDLRKQIGEQVFTCSGDSQTLLNIHLEFISKLDSIMDSYLVSTYDHNLANYLGYGWMYKYSDLRPDDYLKRIRINKWPKEFRENLANTLSKKLNVSGVIKSRIADQNLRAKGYGPPEELAYHRSPMERVNQAITIGNESESEFIMIRRKILFEMSKFVVSDDNSNWMGKMDVEWLYAFNISSTGELVSIHSNVYLDVNGGLMLSSGRSFDRDLIVARVGNNFLENSMIFTGYYGSKPGPWREYNHEALVKFAAKVYSNNERDLGFVWYYANITPRYQEELLNMIRSGSIELNLPWKSVIHVRKNFEIATQVSKAQRMFVLENVQDKRLNNILSYIKRDICYSILDYGMEKLILNLNPAYMIRNGSRRDKVLAYVKILGEMSSRGVDVPITAQ